MLSSQSLTLNHEGLMVIVAASSKHPRTRLGQCNFPLKYLGVPITASRLLKVECSSLVDKTEYKHIPYISWANTRLPKSHGGLGVKNFSAWNKATIPKLVWAVNSKKDVLWVKWIHGRYLKGSNWWSYVLGQNSSYIKEHFKQGCTDPSKWNWQGAPTYKVGKGYKWQLEAQRHVNWTKLVFAAMVARTQATDINSLGHKIRRLKVAPVKNRITYPIFNTTVSYIKRAQN
ncbi:hypothetical protein Cgig2_007177 [Carnegiea gigantea]|uniref:Uncharacterized protein n=1 Tax=Carnegiea gigantea TaxID=171969 RepID=A0A9Q1JL08_9CARY|nr:hypothetical protein Cgig2_007177 [Carnegiea gigantea]